MLLAKILSNLLLKEYFNIHYKPYKCGGCKYSFLKLSYLKKHQNGHFKQHFSCQYKGYKCLKIKYIRGYRYNSSAPTIYSA